MATPASAHLQCAPYAREVSGVALHGNAGTWWGQADGVYRRGHQPTPGAVLAFKSTGAMRYGHVAVVSKVLDSRHVLLNHANWTGHGDIQRAALAVDVSEAGDWSAVRVWHSGTGSLGLRSNPTYGFIYDEHGADDSIDRTQTTLASADVGEEAQAGG
ncbi:CHAP domain-containing protein [Novosphingobium sp.]|uniref:CHAP domain-containing protein n=1 Tax=Novosphingobium sp. TaxID=1874826 RepID=UPI0034541512